MTPRALLLKAYLEAQRAQLEAALAREDQSDAPPDSVVVSSPSVEEKPPSRHDRRV